MIFHAKNSQVLKTGGLFLLICLFTLASCGLFGSKSHHKNHPDIHGKIVFSAQAGGTHQIFTMNVDGSHLKQLTHLPPSGGAVQPSWSPDGSKIVYSTSLHSTSNGFSLYIMNADGSGKHPMNDREGSPVPTPGAYAQWSPDGSKIVFQQCVNCQVSTNQVIFVYDIEADSLIQLTEFKRGVSNRFPTWSPNGSRIAFTSNRDYRKKSPPGYSYNDLYIMDSTGKNVERVSEIGFVESPVWKPKSNIIVFRTFKKSSKVYKINLKSGITAKLFEDSNTRTNIQPISWSQDGEFLLMYVFFLDKRRKSAIAVLNMEQKTLIKIYSPFSTEAILGIDWYTR